MTLPDNLAGNNTTTDVFLSSAAHDVKCMDFYLGHADDEWIAYVELDVDPEQFYKARVIFWGQRKTEYYYLRVVKYRRDIYIGRRCVVMTLTPMTNIERLMQRFV